MEAHQLPSGRIWNRINITLSGCLEMADLESRILGMM